MMTEHHPSDVVLLALAAGTLEAQRDAIAAHVRGCASCRAFVRAMEHVGGILLEELLYGERIIVGNARADRAT